MHDFILLRWEMCVTVRCEMGAFIKIIARVQVLVIVAASHLDAVTFQICSQSFKIMPTAFFAVWLLGQYLTPLQWGSLPVLAVGVVFVTMNGSTPAGLPSSLYQSLTK